ncbi:MAG: alpha-L-fucosidase [Opitutales bacterium]
MASAADWADQVTDQAVRAGARYTVLTTRHHDSYCLFQSDTPSSGQSRLSGLGPAWHGLLPSRRDGAT